MTLKKVLAALLAVCLLAAMLPSGMKNVKADEEIPETAATEDVEAKEPEEEIDNGVSEEAVLTEEAEPIENLWFDYNYFAPGVKRRYIEIEEYMLNSLWQQQVEIISVELRQNDRTMGPDDTINTDGSPVEFVLAVKPLTGYAIPSYSLTLLDRFRLYAKNEARLHVDTEFGASSVSRNSSTGVYTIRWTRTPGKKVGYITLSSNSASVPLVPRVGYKPANIIVNSGNANVVKTVWWDDTEIMTSSIFEAGHYYSVDVYLKPKSGYTFSTNQGTMANKLNTGLDNVTLNGVSESELITGPKMMAMDTDYNDKGIVYGSLCHVWFTFSDPRVAVSGVSVKPTSLNLEVGELYTLTATVSPSNAGNRDVTWSSSNEAVATVDNYGKVKGVGPGSATITVKTAEGGKTATCKVTVTGSAVSVTGVSLDKTSLEIIAGQSAVLTATVKPSSASNKTVKWSSSDTKVAEVITGTSVAGGVVTAKSQGRVTVTATTVDGNKKATCKVLVLFRDVTDKSKAVYNAVYALADLGIVKGYGTYFDVSGPCTRAQFVLFLWRLAGKPAPKSTTLKFTDAADIKALAADYTKAIAWGVEKGIVAGFTSGPNKGKFMPNDPCTRGQVVLFLWRYSGKPSVSGSLTFKDKADIQAMAADYGKAILWASKNNIAGGYSDGTFKPNKNCTRGECVTFLYRLRQ